jgi:molybdate transport repressor ModE-like protein
MIDVRRLKVLREVAEHGTLAAAADVLHLTPSAVSQQLAALEREVGQPVVERNGRGVRLTGAAEVLVGHANLVLAHAWSDPFATDPYTNAARISDSIGFSAWRKGSTKPTVLSTIFRKSANSGEEAFAW